MELMEPKRQKAWGWPAVANFVLGGAGAGLYLVSSVRELLLSGGLAGPDSHSVGIISTLLVCLGFLAVTCEAGRPLRGLYLLGNLRSSWVSVEVLAGALFICSSVMALISPYAIFKVAALSAALSLLVSHGFIVYRARGVTAWNVPPIPALFLISALTMGGGLLFIIGAFHSMSLETSTIAIVGILVIADMGAWAVYLLWSKNRNFTKATLLLGRPFSLFLIVGMGRLLPLMLMSILMTGGPHEGAASGPAIAALIGLSILAGGFFQKVGIFMGASFFRGVVMGVPEDENRHPVSSQNH